MLVNPFGQEIDVADSGEREYTSVPFTVTAAGSTVLWTPDTGKSIRLRKIKAIQDPMGGAAPVIRVFLGAEEYARGFVVAERQRKTGPLDGSLSITLDVAGKVVGTAFLEEI